MTAKLCICSLSFLFVILNCSSSKKAESPHQENRSRARTKEKYVTLARQKYESALKYLFNSDKSYVICMKESKRYPTDILPSLRYFVYDIKSDKIVFEDAPGDAKIKWLSSYQIEVVVIPGIVSGKEGEEGKLPGYVYDCRLRKKVGRVTQDMNK